MKTNFIGIDYGSKLAGTTAICFERDGSLHFLQSVKGKNADAMILDFIKKQRPEKIFIDAPMSLPAAYFHQKSTDYFYRQCDREVRAMSPMFLGGLTARAIQLKNNPASAGIEFYESYPRGLVDELSKRHPGIREHYKKDIGAFLDQVLKIFGIRVGELPTNWHQADALLAWLVGLRFSEGCNLIFGEENEGLIYV